MPRPESKHDFTKKEIQAGILVIASVAVLAAFIIVINRLQPAEKTNVYRARFTNIIGLKENAEVRYGGMLAGRVGKINADPEDSTRIIVEARLKPEIPVTEESIASIEALSLMAEKHLEISTGKKDAKRLADNGELKSITKSGGLIDLPNMDGLVSGSEDLIGDLRDLMGVQAAKEEEKKTGKEMAKLTDVTGDVRDMLGVEEAKKAEAEGKGEAANVTRIMSDLRKFLGVQAAEKKQAEGKGELVALTNITEDVQQMFKKMEPQLEEMLKKMPEIEDSVQKLLNQLNDFLSDNRESLDKTLTGVEDIVTKLRDNSQELIDSLNHTLKNADGLTGDAAEFLKQNRPALEDMLNDLGKTVNNLNVLLGNLKNHPESVLWGKPAEGRKK